MVELPKTEEELQTLIEKTLEEQKVAFEKEKNELAYKLRKEGNDKLENYKKSQSLTEEERAKELANEKAKLLEDELNSLRAYKKTSELASKLEKEGLPKYFVNDNRLLSAEEGEIDKVLKVVKGEYEGSLPKGNTHSSVVSVQTSGNVPQKSSKEQAYQECAETLKELF